MEILGIICDLPTIQGMSKPILVHGLLDVNRVADFKYFMPKTNVCSAVSFSKEFLNHIAGKE